MRNVTSLTFMTFIFIFSSIHSIKCSESKLLMVQVVFRHGERNIVVECPNDAYFNATIWPGGYGQLTNRGKQQHYELGKWFRHRYENLLPNNCSSDNIHVVSTDTARTLASAASNLAGLFPPTESQVSCQSIPIHTVPANMDGLLYSKKPCPLFDDLHVRSENYLATNEKYKTIFPLIEEFCGLPVGDLETAAEYYDNMVVERSQNKTLPDWIIRLLDSTTHFEQSVYALRTATPTLARLKGGFLVKQILDDFTNETLSNLSPGPSFIMYSGHDTTIINVLNSLGLYDSILPAHASCVLFELHKSKGDFYIQIFYKKSENDDDPMEMNIPKCGSKCELKIFREIYEEIIPTKSYDEECQLP